MYIYQCGACGHIAPAQEFKYGSGREYGKHPEHRYCPRCSQSIDWFGHSTPCYQCPAYLIANKKRLVINCIAICPVLREQNVAVLQKYEQIAQKQAI
jgi:rubredoxin